MIEINRFFRSISTSDCQRTNVNRALRNPTMRRISQDLDVAWKDRLASIIRDGVADDEFTCADPEGAAWRLAGLLDGLGVQFTVHEGVLSRADLLAYVRQAASRELDIPVSAFARAHRRTAEAQV